MKTLIAIFFAVVTGLVAVIEQLVQANYTNFNTYLITFLFWFGYTLLAMGAFKLFRIAEFLFPKEGEQWRN